MTCGQNRKLAHRQETLHSSSHDCFLASNTGLPPCWAHPVVLMLVLHICMVPMPKRKMQQPDTRGPGMSSKHHYFLSEIRNVALGHTKGASKSMLHFLLVTESVRQTTEWLKIIDIKQDEVTGKTANTISAL